jgi:hypothetical protein
MRLSEMSNQPRAEKINKVVESRFGFKIDYQNLTFKKAFGIVQGLNETLDKARRTHGVHTAEQNPQYMEMFMVRESLNRWMVENRQTLITESEMAKAEATLAAKDMVDSIQDMLEKIGKMQNEQLPALLDTIRDQIGDQQAETFKGAVTPLLQQLSQTLQQGRETADQAARQLTGEGGSDMGLGGMGGGDMGGMGGAPAPEPGMGGDELGSDEFGATGAAAGGTDELGRERRGGLEEGKKKNDGNLANNAKPYGKVTRGDVVAGRLGKDAMGGKAKKK